jgi:hypothetical protein
MTKTMTATRSLLLAGALAFAALPVLAQTAPSTQPAAPTAGSTVTPGSMPTAKSTTATPSAAPAAKPAADAAKSATDAGKSTTNTGKAPVHGKKIAATHSKSKVHAVSAKKPMDTKAQKPAAGATSGTGTVDTATPKKP